MRDQSIIEKRRTGIVFPIFKGEEEFLCLYFLQKGQLIYCTVHKNYLGSVPIFFYKIMIGNCFMTTNNSVNFIE